MRRRFSRCSVVGLALAALLSLGLSACVGGPGGASDADDGPRPGPPTTQITCNNTGCEAGPYRASQVNVALTATGGIGSLTTRYTVDGTNPATSPTAVTYTAAFNIAKTRTIRYYTFDSNGSTETPKSRQVKIDLPPVRTVVSLTFDDGQSSHAATGPMLTSHGMLGTYYINSELVDTSAYYMSWPQIHGLADAGHEIGGHTLHHTSMATIDAPTARTEICQDRQRLLNEGFSPVSSFSYPEASVNAIAKQVVRLCGYTTGRGVGSISSAGCDGCPYAETIPPGDPYDLKTPPPANNSTTLPQLQSYVTQAETHGGGWVVIDFHGICDDLCTRGSSSDVATFAAFLDWLQPRTAIGTIVQTVGQAIAGGRSLP